jgi:hypothetical protein
MAFIYNLSDTWNDAATTWNGIKLAVTNTASSASSNLLNLTVTGATTASFVVDKSGNLALNGTVNKITMTAPATGATLTLADNSTFITSGAYSSTFTFTGTTTLTFPTSGTVTALGNTTTGSGAIVLASSPTLITPALGTPSSATLTNATGLPISTGVSGLGTGVSTALAVNVGSAGAFVVNGGALGTPSSGTLTNATGLPISTGVSGLGTGIATFLATPSSANLASAVTDETGSGPLVFATSPTFTSQVTFGTASSTRGTLVLANTSANTVTLQSSNSTAANYTLTFPAAAPVNGYYLQTDTNGVLSWAAGGGGGGGSPGGSNTQVQFNDSATFGGAAAFTYDKTTYTLGLGVASTTTGTFKLYNSASANAVSLKSGNNSAAWSLTLPTSAGTNGQALTTDGSGNTSWTTIASGLTVGSTAISGGTSGRVLYDNAGVLGEYPTSATTVASSVVLRDANVNITSNAFFAGTTSTAATGGTITLTAASTPVNVVTGSGGETFTLPDATTLPLGAIFSFNNNQTSGTIVVKNTSATTIATFQSGAYGTIVLIANGTSSGTWEPHFQAPANVSWSTNTLDYPGSITSATWNGVAVAVNRGGTGLTSGTSGGVLYYSATGTLASSSALAANALVVGGGAGVAPSTTTTASGILTFLGTPSSANLAAAVTDETGTGALVFGTSPTFTTSAIFPAGTVSAPGITTTGDTNTGIYFPAADTIAVTTNGTEDMRFTPQNNVTLNSATFSPTTPITAGNMAMTGTLAMGSSFKRNRLINGNMYIAQRATSATVTAGTAVPTASTGYPCVDRWFVYSTGANVTAAQVAGTGSNKNLLQITGAASVTAVGVGQRIEQLNSYDLAGQTATLSVELANSLLTTVTWTASYATTADTFGTIGTPTKTQIATGTFTVTSTLTRYTTNITIPAAATTGIEILFTVGAQTSGTWDVNNVQLEVGSISTPYERQIYSDQLAQCQRYYQITAQLSGATPSATTVNAWGTISPTMRVAPTLGQTGVLNFQGDGTNNANQSATGLGSNFSTAYAILLLGVPNFAGFTTARPGTLAVPGSNSNYITMSAEL